MEAQKFIRIAYEKDKVQDVSQAFEDYPVEEWHKGKIENMLYEPKNRIWTV